jgi:membrane protein DedA with SNARE-associated domain
VSFFGEQDLAHLLATYGYWVVFALVGVESTGVPLPGETMLVTAALYAGTTHRLNLGLVIVAAAVGAILGDNLGFWIGRTGGYRLVRRYGRYIRLNERRLKLGQYLFQKYGGTVVFVGRFVSVLRTWAAFLAGVNRMDWWRFLAFNVAGGALWATIYGAVAPENDENGDDQNCCHGTHHEMASRLAMKRRPVSRHPAAGHCAWRRDCARPSQAGGARLAARAHRASRREMDMRCWLETAEAAPKKVGRSSFTRGPLPRPVELP